MTLLQEEVSLEDRLRRQGYVFCDGHTSQSEFLEITGSLGQSGPQYDGRHVWSIKPNPASKGGYHSLSNTELQPHTECYEFEAEPPRYLALWCREPGLAGEGHTYLGDLNQCLRETTTERERSELSSTPVNFFSTPGLQDEGLGDTYQGPMLNEHPDRASIIRFSVRCMDSRALPWMTERKVQMKRWLEDNRIEVRWSAGSYLIWDNHRMAHWRSAFSDLNRELLRVWLY